jgi:hypothetical protein
MIAASEYVNHSNVAPEPTVPNAAVPPKVATVKPQSINAVLSVSVSVRDSSVDTYLWEPKRFLFFRSVSSPNKFQTFA